MSKLRPAVPYYNKGVWYYNEFSKQRKTTIPLNMCLQYFRHYLNAFCASFPFTFAHVCDVGTVIIFIF